MYPQSGFMCFFNNWIRVVDFQEEDHRSKVPFYHIKDSYCQYGSTVSVDLEPTKKVFARFLPCKVSLPSSFPLCTWKKVTICSLHISSGEFLEGEEST